MRKVLGAGVWIDPGADAPLLERDSIQCGHCGKTVFVKPGTATTVYLIPTADGRHWLEEPGAMCGCCWRPVCLPCHDTGTCTPLEAFLEQLEGGRGRAIQV